MNEPGDNDDGFRRFGVYMDLVRTQIEEGQGAFLKKLAMEQEARLRTAQQQVAEWQRRCGDASDAYFPVLMQAQSLRLELQDVKSELARTQRALVRARRAAKAKPSKKKAPAKKKRKR